MKINDVQSAKALDFQVHLRRFDDTDLEIYLKEDWILNKLEVLPKPLLLSDEWLFNIPAKRMMFDSLYKDLITKGRNYRCLDIGTGQTNLLPILNREIQLTCLDTFPPEILEVDNFHPGSWEETQLLKRGYNWDLITCNDVFPNVDNRIIQFLELALPRTKRLIMTLTAHSTEKEFQRLSKNDGEILSWQAWDSEILLFKLSSFFGIEFWKIPEYYDSNPKLFQDKRTVYQLEVSRK